MQFVTNGPEVPGRLLQAHEDGSVVFFCGAGASYPAGLPGFPELTKKLYDDLHVDPDPVQQAAIDAKHYDKAIDLLERAVVGRRQRVRQTLAKILTPNLDTPNATATHSALLTLGRDRHDRMRLVTTNFDRLFEKVIAMRSPDIRICQAPMLPVPKKRWDSLVYLHGLLPDDPAHSDLDDLVVSSGDFGRAYLTERWAARFVGELFRNYTVCFVGYSIDDPVLRYMTDALAADRLLGEPSLQPFAFGSCGKGKEDEHANQWRAKNVTPILYSEDNGHALLHATLHEWEKTYRDGVSGKESIVVAHAGLHPTKSTEEEGFAGRVLWALSDPSGLPAKRFAEFDPVPPLDWLGPLSDDIYDHTDLSRFGVQACEEIPDSLKFSLLRRPADHVRTPWMTLVDEGGAGTEWDKVMLYVARWLTRHLDDPKLLLWLAQRGGRLHRQFAAQIKQRFRKLDELNRADKTEELKRIRHNSPHAIPRPKMRTLWGLLLAGRVKATGTTVNFASGANIGFWRHRLEVDGLTTALRMELRDMLTPCVSFHEPIPWGRDPEDPNGSEPHRELVDCKVVLSIDDVHAALDLLREMPRWSKALPDLLDDFGALLRDAMDLARDLGRADDRYDRSYIYLPSIAQHDQNIHVPDWAVLIELTRDAWLATKEVAPERARRAAENWCSAPYPVFRRLALFAATQEDVIPPRLGLDWMLAHDHWWLWSVETHREAMRLLVALAPGLDAKSMGRLEQAVLAGPPPAMYGGDIEPEHWAWLVEREIWVRLAMIDRTGVDLGTDAKARLDELSLLHPEWQLETEQRDEFPTWMGAGPERRGFVATPRPHRELAGWLEKPPSTNVSQSDDWPKRCQDSFRAAAWALCRLARDGTWPAARWRDALHVWSDDMLIERSWRYVAPALAAAPSDKLQPLAHHLGPWLQKAPKVFAPDEELFIRVCRAILKLDYSDDADKNDDDPVTRAINHPVGHVTEALLNWWNRRPLKDRQRLPDTVRQIFTELCDVRLCHVRHGRVLLASRAVTLFRVDEEWTTQCLLPLFDWSRSTTEARAAWRGFLWSPRLHRPLLESIKEPFLDTASHCGELHDAYAVPYAALLTSAALDRGATFTILELAAATAALPEGGLRGSAEVLVDAVEAADERHAEFWRNRVQLYLQEIWPQQLDRKTPEISECFGRLCIAAGDAFPEALEELQHWLQPLLYAGRLLGRLKDSDLCSKFPAESLDLLRRVIGDEPPLGDELRECLQLIQSAEPPLKDGPRFRRLLDLLHGQGQELE